MGYDAGLQNVESHGPQFLKPGPHTFLHRMKTSGVKIRPVLKSFLLHNYRTRKVDIAKIVIITCENNYNR